MVSVESERLATFLRSRGAHVHEDLEFFGRGPSGTRGVFAAAPIAKGELLLRLPRGAVLAACDAGDAACDWMPEGARNASPILRTALFLLRERALGEGSAWAPYMSTLPASYDTLEHWGQEELAALGGTSVHDELAGLRDKKTGDLDGPARVLWERSIAPMVEASPELWPDASLASFLHACATVRTRGFYDTAAGGGGPYMLPAIDMLNHACKGTATSLVVERGSGGSGEGGGEGGGGGGERGERGGGAKVQGARGSSSLVFSMEAERALRAGEEVVHTYDELDDAQLLLTYGFVSAAGEG